MTGKIKGRLFLTNSEREEILNMADSILEADVDTMEEWEIGQRWAKILYSLVFGKRLQDSQQFPVIFVKDSDESIN